MIHKISLRITNLIAMELNLENTRLNIISYGIEVLLGGLFKWSIFIIVPLILGVFKQFITACIIYAILRIPSGGRHCSAFYKCLIVSFSIFIAIAFIAKYSLLTAFFIKSIFWFSICIGFIIFFLKAPVDVSEKPILSTSRKKTLKIISCSVVAIIPILFIYLKPGNDLLLASSLAILFHSFILTRPGNNLLCWIDNKI